MTRRRDRNDGLPFRVYERRGIKRYSIGYKNPDGTWAYRLSCAIADRTRIQELRSEAINRSTRLGLGAPAGDTFQDLVNHWLRWQVSLPAQAIQKRAASTLEENRREAAMLCKAWGRWLLRDIKKGDAYDYLDACLLARDKNGKSRPRAAKGNKEIGLARVILEFGVRTRRLESNPFEGIEKLATPRVDRYVEDFEMALAAKVGRREGGPLHIAAVALMTGYYCVRRSGEVLSLTREQLRDEGIEWHATKRQRGEARKVGLIEWSPELKATIDEALSIKRREGASELFVFGNMSGNRYTKGGWKATLQKLMNACEVEAGIRNIPFKRFSLQDCRPKGVSDKMARGDRDVVDATMHSSERMVRQVYDRRRVRVAKPAG